MILQNHYSLQLILDTLQLTYLSLKKDIYYILIHKDQQIIVCMVSSFDLITIFTKKENSRVEYKNQ